VTNPSNPSIAQSFKAGDQLAGCYTLKELMPPQGCCVVWLAHDEELNKDIVLHFVPDAVAADTRAMSELKNEAKRNRQLIHPRIIRVHDLVEDERWAAISMDHVQGETLASLQQKRPGKVFNPSDLATGVAELCQTIEDAHRIELFHRDLCPENIIATGNGIMVQKFGISRVILDSLARAGQSIPGSRDLTYISPQQLDGEKATRADDIYSMGATVYDLLTGAPAFSQGDLIPQIRKNVPPLVSERRAAQKITGEPVPKAWDDAIAACLAKNPEERPKSAAEAGTRFSTAKSGAAAAPAPAETPAPASPAKTAPAPAEAGKIAATIAGTAAVAAAAAEGAKDAGKPAAPAKSEPAPETPKAATSEPAETAAKQPKRPWTPGPGKTPVIAEANVISNTPVPKGQAKTEPATDTGAAKAAEPAGVAKKTGPGGPTTPTGFPLRAFVEVDQDTKKAKGKSSPFLMTGVVVLIAVVILGYLVARNNSSSTEPQTAAASSGTGSQTGSAPAETTSSPVPVEAASATPSAPVNLAANSTPAPSASPDASAAPQPSATPEPSAAPTAAVAEATPAPPSAAPMASPAPVATVPVSALEAMSQAQTDQLVADKTKAVDQAKAALTDAEKNAQAQAAAQTQAASTVQSLQTQVKQKADAAAAAKTAATAAAAVIAQQQDALTKARADADAAQKAAAAKAQAADQLAKSLQDAQTAAQAKQAAAQQAAADADQASRTVADRQKAADDAAKAAAEAEKTRQQQAQAVTQAQADLAQLQTNIAQTEAAKKSAAAAAEAARVQQERAAETARLTAQAATAVKAAEDAQKALEAAQKAVADAQKAQAEAEKEAEAARNAPVPLPAASPAASGTLPAGASASPAPGSGAPTLSVKAPSTSVKVDQALTNSLGMRFAPVGKVFFCIWPTRVQDFEAFAKASGYSSTAWQDPGFKQGPDHPVVNVSWNDANQFCLWLTEKEHHAGILAANEAYRLPTDLEWSTAVGLPTETGRTPEARDMDTADVYPWGTQWPPPAGSGNYTGEETDSDVAIKGYNDGFAWTSPVGSFTANKLGLYDMGGNVWEWVMDWWNPEQKEKVLRGASWNNGALKLSLLSSCREKASADLRLDDYGFRIVLAPEGTRKRHAQ
jgi:formylglycine-generating enzyme required for sulfatase activity